MVMFVVLLGVGMFVVAESVGDEKFDLKDGGILFMDVDGISCMVDVYGDGGRWY